MCIALILIVLLQTGKGSELAGAFGGGTSNTAFGVTGGISFIGKMTTVAAFCFLFTSFSLSLLPIGKSGTSLINEEAAPEAPQAPAQDSSNESDAKAPEESVPADMEFNEAGIEESNSIDADSDVILDNDQSSETEQSYPESNSK